MIFMMDEETQTEGQEVEEAEKEVEEPTTEAEAAAE